MKWFSAQLPPEKMSSFLAAHLCHVLECATSCYSYRDLHLKQRSEAFSYRQCVCVYKQDWFLLELSKQNLSHTP